MLSKTTTAAIVAVITAVWAANFLAPFFVHGYVRSDQIDAIFTTLVGGTLGVAAAGNRTPGKDAAPTTDTTQTTAEGTGTWTSSSPTPLPDSPSATSAGSTSTPGSPAAA